MSKDQKSGGGKSDSSKPEQRPQGPRHPAPEWIRRDDSAGGRKVEKTTDWVKPPPEKKK